MAEFVMKDKVRELGVEDRFEIASAATSAEELGNPVYFGTKEILAKHGISCEGKTARRLTKKDYASYDLLVGMETINLYNMRKICGVDSEKKMKRLLDFTDKPRDIDDPWYHNDFQRTWNEVNAGCDGLLKALGY